MPFSTGVMRYRENRPNAGQDHEMVPLAATTTSSNKGTIKESRLTKKLGMSDQYLDVDIDIEEGGIMDHDYSSSSSGSFETNTSSHESMGMEDIFEEEEISEEREQSIQAQQQEKHQLLLGEEPGEEEHPLLQTEPMEQSRSSLSRDSLDRTSLGALIVYGVSTLTCLWMVYSYELSQNAGRLYAICLCGIVATASMVPIWLGLHLLAETRWQLEQALEQNQHSMALLQAVYPDHVLRRLLEQQGQDGVPLEMQEGIALHPPTPVVDIEAGSPISTAVNMVVNYDLKKKKDEEEDGLQLSNSGLQLSNSDDNNSSDRPKPQQQTQQPKRFQDTLRRRARLSSFRSTPSNHSSHTTNLSMSSHHSNHNNSLHARQNSNKSLSFQRSFRDLFSSNRSLGSSNNTFDYNNNSSTSVNVLQQTKSITDFFPFTTIMHAEIMGFIAWSSTRSPDQVFYLLETIYGEFDRLARQQRQQQTGTGGGGGDTGFGGGVFKVQATCECFTAVSGLPEPDPDHAVTMARYSSHVLQGFQASVEQLEVSLGPDTGDLELRIGLHSGPVTGGILQGQGNRFQLFGDTLNHAVLVEKDGSGNSIHVTRETAHLLQTSGKKHWLKMREPAQSGNTYWLTAAAGAAGATAAAQPQQEEGSAFMTAAARNINHRKSFFAESPLLPITTPRKKKKKPASATPSTAATKSETTPTTTATTATPQTKAPGTTEATDQDNHSERSNATRPTSDSDDSSSSSLGDLESLPLLAQQAILKIQERGSFTVAAKATSNSETDINNKYATAKEQRLIEWTVDQLAVKLKKIVARRRALERYNKQQRGNRQNKSDITTPITTDDDATTSRLYYSPPPGQNIVDELAGMIEFPRCDPGLLNEEDKEKIATIALDPCVVEELTSFVEKVATYYSAKNPFHEFSHALHVIQSAVKMLERYVFFRFFSLSIFACLSYFMDLRRTRQDHSSSPLFFRIISPAQAAKEKTRNEAGDNGGIKPSRNMKRSMSKMEMHGRPLAYSDLY